MKYQTTYRRIFLIVMDSVGIGALPDAHLFGDVGSNTLVHTAEKAGGLTVPTLEGLGLGLLADIKGVRPLKNPHAIVTTAREMSSGKDTMTGHWEIMGLLTTKPFKTFTDTGFPKALLDELSLKTGHAFIGNIAASGTEIIKDLGEQHMKTKALIVYTSADSVLQIAAHEKVIPLQELYRVCEVARELCMRPEYRLGRIIARPFIGTNKLDFTRTPNRHDYALSPTAPTVLDLLVKQKLTTSCIGKIGDIFNQQGVTVTAKTISNQDGMEKTIAQAKENTYRGLCFVNLVEFDSEYGHRRNPIGYAKAIEAFDRQLKTLIEVVLPDDLIIITADHGNDPTHRGTDHTRERVPVLIYSKILQGVGRIPERPTFADIGQTVLKNFDVKASSHMIGKPIDEIFK